MIMVQHGSVLRGK